MKRQVITFNIVEGFHNYKDAPEWCAYLRARHRHLFQIRVWFEVGHNNREVEINEQQHKVEEYLNRQFDKPCEFGSRSCEDIAELLLNKFKNATQVEVTEDGYGGATLTR